MKQRNNELRSGIAREAEFIPANMAQKGASDARDFSVSLCSTVVKFFSL
jgi:hypothetical protein